MHIFNREKGGREGRKEEDTWLAASGKSRKQHPFGDDLTSEGVWGDGVLLFTTALLGYHTGSHYFSKLNKTRHSWDLMELLVSWGRQRATLIDTNLP